MVVHTIIYTILKLINDGALSYPGDVLSRKSKKNCFSTHSCELNVTCKLNENKATI